MTAEEKLKEWYKACEQKPITEEMIRERWRPDTKSGVVISPEHIDLIANLVVERLISNKVGE